MRTLATILTVLLLSVIGGCDSKPDRASDGSSASRPEAEPQTAQFVEIPGTRVRLVQPEGFVGTDRFPGLVQKETGASIMVTEIPGPYSECIAGFDAPTLKAGGMSLIEKEAVTIDGWSGLLLHVEQPAYGQIFAKWIAVFGDEDTTVMITATFPKDLKEKLSATLRGTVIGTKYDVAKQIDPLADLTFTVASSEKLKFTKRIGNMLLYTMDGVIPTKSPEHPLLVLGYAVSDVAPADKKQFAERRITQTAHVKDLQITTSEPITVGDLNGYEIEATANDSDTDVPMIVYQVMLYEKDTYFVAQGLAGADYRTEYLPVFQAMVRSFQRK